MEHRLAELERRLARAEQRARLMVGLGLGALVGATVLMAAKPAVTQTPGSTVKAPFTVVDTQGRPLLEVGENRQEVYLRLCNKAGEVSGEWISGPDNVTLYLNRTGNVQAGTTLLSAHRAGGRLDFLSPRRKQQVVLEAWDDYKQLAFWNEDESIVPQARLRVWKGYKDLTFSTFTGDRIDPQVSLTAAGKDNTKLTFYDPEGKPRTTVP